MHIIDQKMLGIIILFLLAALVIIKRAATGTILEKPKPDPLLWLVNLFNLFFLLAANPLAAVLLITGSINEFDPEYSYNFNGTFDDYRGIGLNYLSHRFFTDGLGIDNAGKQLPVRWNRSSSCRYHDRRRAIRLHPASYVHCGSVHCFRTHVFD